MKNLNYILFCFPLFFLAASCDDDDLSISSNEAPLEELNRRVPITQEGAGTFGCLINGEVWTIRTGDFGASSSEYSCFYIEDNRKLSIGARNYYPQSHNGHDAFVLIVNDFSIDSLKSYSPNNNNPIFNPRFVDSSKYPGTYFKDTSKINRITLNAINQEFMVGTFQLHAIDTITQKTLIITDGRFDLPYQVQ